jgi:hypothetical protein
MRDITITVDTDNDEVRITRGKDVAHVVKILTRHPADHLAVLTEVLHALDAPGVSLRTQADGTIDTIAEW